MPSRRPTPSTTGLLLSDHSADAAPAAAPETERQVLLVDCDAMFCTVARAVDPAVAGRAPELIVGGEGPRGVVCSATYGLRALGVHAGLSTAVARRLAPGVLVVPVPRAAVRDTSAGVRAALDAWSPSVESASVDEFYVEMTGLLRDLYPGEDVEAVAGRMRSAVLAATGVTVSIGIGLNPMVAKMASRSAKPHHGGTGVYRVTPDALHGWLDPQRLGAFPGIGPQSVARYAKFGLHTVANVRALPPDHLVAWFGEREARALLARCAGVDDRPVLDRAEAQGVSREETFDTDVTATPVLRAQLRVLSREVAAELRRAGHRARTVTVRVRDADGRNRQASCTHADGVDTDDALTARARPLLEQLRATRLEPVRRLGVATSNWVPRSIETPAAGAEPAPGAPPEAAGGTPAGAKTADAASGRPGRDAQLSALMDAMQAKYGTAGLGWGAARVVAAHFAPDPSRRTGTRP